MSDRRDRRWVVLALAAGALLALILIWDWNWFQGPLERRVTERTGRAFSIDDLDVRLGWPPRVQMRRLQFANPSWAQRPRMLDIEEASFTIELLPLLRGELILPDVRLVRPDVSLERGPGAADNWTLGTAPPPDPSKPPPQGRAPQIGRLTVDAGVVRFLAPQDETALEVALQTVPAADGQSGLRFEAHGRYQKQAVDAQGVGGAILAIADAETPYPFDARFRVGPTHGKARGSVTGIVALAAADLRLEVAGESLAELFPLLRVSLPPTPPYRIRGQLVREGQTWRFHDFEGRVGDSDLAGDADVRLDGTRPRLVARVSSQRLDLDDLGGTIGAAPQAGPGETASAGQRREAAQERASPRLLPDDPIRLERLRAMDADVHFTGKSIRSRDTPIEDMEVKVLLDDGVLKLLPLKFGVAGGSVESKLHIDARGEALAVDSDILVRRLDLKKLFPRSEMARRSTGLIGGRAAIKGRGNSFAELLAHGNGTLGLASGGGQVSNLLLELVGLDAAEIVRFLFRGDKTVALRCAVADMTLTDGVLRTNSAVVDTTDTNITIKGGINLRDETLDLELHPLPKDYSPVSLRSPLHLTGRLKDPDIGLDKGLLLRGGLAAVLGALAAPLAALVPLIESGPGDDADCARLVAAVEQHAGARAGSGAPTRQAPPPVPETAPRN